MLSSNESIVISIPETGRHSPTLDRVKPKQMLLFKPMPCEQQAAYIRNEAVSGMEDNSVAVVSYRYVQSKKGQYNTSLEAAFYFFAFLSYSANHYRMDKDDDSYTAYLAMLGSSLLIIFTFCSILPNIGNALRYNETKNGCRDWLTKNIGSKHFDRVDKIKLSPEGVKELVEYIHKNDLGNQGTQDIIRYNY